MSVISLILLMEKKLSCGEFSAFHVWQLWGNQKQLEKNQVFAHDNCGESEIVNIWHAFDEKMSPHVENLCYFVVQSVLS